jgi:hypothetical protein
VQYFSSKHHVQLGYFTPCDKLEQMHTTQQERDSPCVLWRTNAFDICYDFYYFHLEELLKAKSKEIFVNRQRAGRLFGSALPNNKQHFPAFL